MNLLLYLNWLQMIFDLSTPVLSKPFIIVQRLSTYFVAKECINDSGRQWYKNSWIFRCQLDGLLGNYGSFGSPGVRCAPSPSLGRVKMLGRLGQNLNSESSVLHERRDNQRANRINSIQQWRMVCENRLCNAV